MFSTVYFRFRNYRNTGAVFVFENTVPFSFPIKKCESKSDGVFRRRFRRFSSLISTARRPCCRSLSITLSLGPSSSPPHLLPLLSILVSRTAAAAAMPLCWARGLRRQRRYSLGKATPLSSPPALRRLLYGSRIPFEIHADLSV